MLRIVDDIVLLIGLVAPLAEEIGRCDSSLAKQLREALSSVALNVAEGSDQRGGRRVSHYSIALGSARESQVALKVAVAWGYVPVVPHAVLDRFDKIIGTLTNLVRTR
jgi:four helix bundle protein